MKFIFTLFLLVNLVYVTLGQSPEHSLWFNISAKNHPAGLFIDPGSSINKAFLQVDIGISDRVQKSPWYYDFEVSSQYTQVHRKNNTVKANLVFLGARSGLTYRFKMPKRSIPLISFGPLLYLPVHDKYDYPSLPNYPPARVFNKPIDGLCYGGYLKAALLFNFSQADASHWHLGIYSEFNAIWVHRDLSPTYLVGGGLEIRYNMF